MIYQESQPEEKRGSNGGRKTNLANIGNVLRKRAAGLKYSAISQ